jgi:D-alanyl-D-alanine carboxypeptidase
LIAAVASDSEKQAPKHGKKTRVASKKRDADAATKDTGKEAKPAAVRHANAKPDAAPKSGDAPAAKPAKPKTAAKPPARPAPKNTSGDSKPAG